MNGRGDERVAALAATVRAVSVRRPLCDDPRTGVRERGGVVGLFVLYDWHRDSDQTRDEVDSRVDVRTGSFLCWESERAGVSSEDG